MHIICVYVFTVHALPLIQLYFILIVTVEFTVVCAFTFPFRRRRSVVDELIVSDCQWCRDCRQIKNDSHKKFFFVDKLKREKKSQINVTKRFRCKRQPHTSTVDKQFAVDSTNLNDGTKERARFVSFFSVCSYFITCINKQHF